MPNLKLYVEASLGAAALTAAQAALPELREILCRELNVDHSACQLSVLLTHSIPDQPQVSAEMLILPRPERTRERVMEVCGIVQAFLAEATGQRMAVRSNMLDGSTYVALK